MTKFKLPIVGFKEYYADCDVVVEAKFKLPIVGFKVHKSSWKMVAKQV